MSLYNHSAFGPSDKLFASMVGWMYILYIYICVCSISVQTTEYVHDIISISLRVVDSTEALFDQENSSHGSGAGIRVTPLELQEEKPLGHWDPGCGFEQ